MEGPLPFCEECGSVGTLLTGVHPATDGLVRWTIYRCGHTKTELHLDDVTTDGPDGRLTRAGDQPAQTPTGS